MTTAPIYLVPIPAPFRRHRGPIALTVAALVSVALSALTPAQPAYAAITPTLSLSTTMDLTPGQSISTTISDPSGVLCDQSYGVGEWSVYLAWYRSGLATPVGYSAQQGTQSNAFVAGSSMTISSDFYVVWLEHDPVQNDVSSWDGTYTAVAGCMTPGFGVGDVVNGDGADHTGTPTSPVTTTYLPVTVSRTSIPQGESLDITMTDASQRWCNFSTGSGFSMGVSLTSQMAGPPDIAIPTNWPGGGVAGVGSFTWSNSLATVTATIPSDAHPGYYTLGVTCVGPSPNFVNGTRAAVFGTIEVTAANPGPGPTPPTPPAPLPSTGYSSALPWLAFVSGIGLFLGFALRHLSRMRRRSH